MATLISDMELRTVLSKPAALYGAITSWSHFRAREPVVEGDCEFLVTDMVAAGCIVMICMVHPLREALLMLLKPDDVPALRERLGELVYEMNSNLLIETMTRPVRTKL